MSFGGIHHLSIQIGKILHEIRQSCIFRNIKNVVELLVFVFYCF